MLPSLSNGVLAGAITLGMVASACSAAPSSSPPAASGIHKIKHVIVIMQENRSFDSYFGTFPGADGIPMTNGVPAACVPDPQGRPCVRPYHDSHDRNRGGPHNARAGVADVDGGKMDGFIVSTQRARRLCRDPNAPNCAGTDEVMGYHDAREIPNYWKYARDFVLQDHLFEPNASWSLPQHLFLVSEWSARCAIIGDPMSCADALQTPDMPADFGRGLAGVRGRGARAAGRLGARGAAPGPAPGRPDYAWTDLTYLLHQH